MSDLRSQFLRSQFQFRSQLWGKLIPFIEVLRENNIANIEPIPDMTDEEVEARELNSEGIIGVRRRNRMTK